MRTPQFQLQRLKKQLASERQNRDELEVELAENLKLIMEKGQLLVSHGGVWGGVSGAETSPGFSDCIMALTPPQLCLCMVHPARPQVSTVCGFGAFLLSKADRAGWFAVPGPVVDQGDPSPLIWSQP